MLTSPTAETILSIRSIMGNLSFSQRPLERTHALLCFKLKGIWGSLETLTRAEISFLGFTLLIWGPIAEPGPNVHISRDTSTRIWVLMSLSSFRTHYCFLINSSRKRDWCCSDSSKKSKLGIPSCSSLFPLCLHKRQTTLNGISATEPWYSLSS